MLGVRLSESLGNVRVSGEGDKSLKASYRTPAACSWRQAVAKAVYRKRAALVRLGRAAATAALGLPLRWRLVGSHLCSFCFAAARSSTRRKRLQLLRLATRAAPPAGSHSRPPDTPPAARSRRPHRAAPRERRFESARGGRLGLGTARATGRATKSQWPAPERSRVRPAREPAA